MVAREIAVERIFSSRFLNLAASAARAACNSVALSCLFQWSFCLQWKSGPITRASISLNGSKYRSRAMPVSPVRYSAASGDWPEKDMGFATSLGAAPSRLPCARALAALAAASAAITLGSLYGEHLPSETAVATR
eukprot:scaffold99889_cov29-Tisochrysis_lutea.AAC.1